MTDGACASPRLIKRHCGGWLAVSGCFEPIKIGVTGETEDDARRGFAASIERTREILSWGWIRRPPERECAMVADDYLRDPPESPA